MQINITKFGSSDPYRTSTIVTWPQPAGADPGGANTNGFMIDVGYPDDGLERWSAVQNPRLLFVILTHLHEKHVDGLNSLIVGYTAVRRGFPVAIACNAGNNDAFTVYHVQDILRSSYYHTSRLSLQRACPDISIKDGQLAPNSTTDLHRHEIELPCALRVFAPPIVEGAIVNGLRVHVELWSGHEGIEESGCDPWEKDRWEENPTPVTFEAIALAEPAKNAQRTVVANRRPMTVWISGHGGESIVHAACSQT